MDFDALSEDSVFATLQTLVRTFRHDKTEEKLRALEQLRMLIGALEERAEHVVAFSLEQRLTWPEELREALWPMLRVKNVGPVLMEQLLFVSSKVWSWFGSSWVRGKYPHRLELVRGDTLGRELRDSDSMVKFAEMLVQLSRLEICLNLSEYNNLINWSQDALPPPETSTLILSCFSVIDMTISMLIEEIDRQESEDADENSDTNIVPAEVIGRLHTIFVEVFKVIIEYVHKASTDCERPIKSPGLLVASVQLLGSWLQDDFQLPSETAFLLMDSLGFCFELQIGSEKKGKGFVDEEFVEKVGWWIHVLLPALTLLLDQHDDAQKFVERISSQPDAVESLLRLWQHSALGPSKNKKSSSSSSSLKDDDDEDEDEDEDEEENMNKIVMQIIASESSILLTKVLFEHNPLTHPIVGPHADTILDFTTRQL